MTMVSGLELIWALQIVLVPFGTPHAEVQNGKYQKLFRFLLTLVQFRPMINYCDFSNRHNTSSDWFQDPFAWRNRINGHKSWANHAIGSSIEQKER